MSARKYQATLVKVMSFLDDHHYDKDHEFTPEHLGQLKPADLMRWFNDQTFGDPLPPHSHNLNPIVRCHSIMFWKKALSFFMPNRLMAWNQLNNVGNPTRSCELNDLIKFAKKKEARQQGAVLHARRSIKDAEYACVLELLKEKDNILCKYGIPAMMNFQFHLIARIDCTTQVSLANLKEHDQFDFCLKTKLNWSKNVLEERDAPWQVMIPSMNHTRCVFLSTVIWLETFIGSSPAAALTPYLFAFSDNINVPKGGEKSKATVQDIFCSSIFKRPEFEETGPLGSHSVRKFSSSHARKNGASKDQKDLRGRWKAAKRVSDVYDDIELPYPDAKVAGLLCIGGPCKYVVREDSGVTDKFILTYVTPNTRTRLGDRVALILGKALLWYVFHPDAKDYLPPAMYQRIMDAYAARQVLPANTNPVLRKPIIITGDEAEVYIDEIPEEVANAGENNGAVGGQVGGGFLDRPIREQLLALHSQLLNLRRENEELRSATQQDRLERNRQYQTLNSNLRRVAMQPAHRAAPVVANNPPQATMHQIIKLKIRLQSPREQLL